MSAASPRPRDGAAHRGELLLCVLASSIVFAAVEMEKWHSRRAHYGEKLITA